MQVTFEWSDWRNGWFWWVQSVYVRVDYRGRGVFRMLYEHVRQAGTHAPATWSAFVSMSSAKIGRPRRRTDGSE